MDRKEVKDYFARYAQKKNQGRFKRQLLKLEEFDMSYIGQEDWVHIDQHWEQVNQLEEKIADLEISVQASDSELVSLLAEIIETRWRYSDYSDLHQDLGEVINLYKPLVDKAVEELGRRYPNYQKTKEAWGL